LGMSDNGGRAGTSAKRGEKRCADPETTAEKHDFNPLDAECSAAEGRLNDLRRRLAAVNDDLAWLGSFDSGAAARELELVGLAQSEFAVRAEQLEVRIAALSEAIERLAEGANGLEQLQQAGFNIGRLLAARKQRRSTLDSHRRQRAEAKADLAKVVAERALGESRANEVRTQVERWRTLDACELADESQRLAAEVADAEAVWNQLTARALVVDRAISGPLLELIELRREAHQLEAEASTKAGDAKRLGSELQLAIALQDKLGRAYDGAARKKVHEDCERQLGVGSPGRAISELRKKLNSLDRSTRDDEHRADRVRRDVAKIEQRIRQLAERAAREITALVVDGNNCCYQHSTFIGLAALSPLARALASRYDTTIVFDAAIRGLLGISDDALRASLPGVTVHVVATRAKADETILACARDSTTWIVSNDRFAEFRDKPAVSDHRLIRHEIVSDRVIIHDLDIDEQLTQVTGLEER